ncbi:unnamed protein product [Schistosoma margrebowiei]|uniref:Uncharacterized protein n=1 Tax=Schistosoma margrebowiei TaxID=48269 RepID=A0AA85A7A3_9TREM|nr:unnamed protein product [Schistosoma margrebowiei]
MNILHFYLLGVVLHVSSHRFVYNKTQIFIYFRNDSYNTSENIDREQFSEHFNTSFLNSLLKDQNTNSSLDVQLKIKTENRTINLHSNETNFNTEKMNFPNNTWSQLNFSSFPFMMNESDDQQHEESVEFKSQKFETRLQELANISDHIQKSLFASNLTTNWLFI